MAAYKTIYQHQTQSDDPHKLVTDPSLYTGTGGVVLTLQKVCQFLKHEAENANIEGEEETKDQIQTAQNGFKYSDMKAKYDEALKYNLNLVKRDKSGNFNHNCSSFFLSAQIGIHTILATDFFEEGDFSSSKCRQFKKLIT